MLSKKPAARAEHVHPPQKVVLRDAIFEPELVKTADPRPAAAAPSSPTPAAADRSTTGITVRSLSQALIRQHRPIAVIAGASPYLLPEALKWVRTRSRAASHKAVDPPLIATVAVNYLLLCNGIFLPCPTAHSNVEKEWLKSI